MSGHTEQFMKAGGKLVKISSFGEALRFLRSQGKGPNGAGEGLSHREVATFCGVSKSDVKLWEDGKILPVGLPMKKLLIILPRLRYYAAKMTPVKLEPEPVAEAEIDPEIEPKLEAPEPPKTFGAAVRQQRISAGIERADVAGILATTTTHYDDADVESIENDTGEITERLYDDLVLLFPELSLAPRPSIVKGPPKVVPNVLADTAMALAFALASKRDAIMAYESGRRDYERSADLMYELLRETQKKKNDAMRALYKTTLSALEAQAALHKVVGMPTDALLLADIKKARKDVEGGLTFHSDEEIRRLVKDLLKGIEGGAK